MRTVNRLSPQSDDREKNEARFWLRAVSSRTCSGMILNELRP